MLLPLGEVEFKISFLGFFYAQCFELLIFDLYDKITMSTMSLMCLVRVVELAIKYK